MDIIRHLHFCPPGTPFFDLPARSAAAEDDFSLVHDALPEGWSRAPGSEWVVLSPPGVTLPRQGWKIHVSATLENAGRVLDVVAKYCLTERVMFKFIGSRDLLQRRNSKYGDRSGSGKFVTVYPLDDQHFERILHELGDLLDGESGPYILSDLRWRSGPLYVRYGGFVLQAVRSESGELIHCIEDPDGRLVPDRRGPGFRPPEWVTLPACLAEAVAARNAGTLRDFPYRVTKAVHFSNGGGVYRGTDTRDGTEVLLREARPHAGLDAEGRDAVARHEQEHWALRRLTGLPCIPRLIDYRKGHEHYFLVREYVEGTALSRELVRRNPLLKAVGSAADVAEYTAWALDLLDQIERGIDAMHDRGVVFADLHPGNILVRPDGRVVFIDFETAGTPDATTVQTMGAVGFVAPAGYTGRAIDRYALGCLRLALFAPQVAVLPWGPEKADQLIDVITSYYPVPEDFAERVHHDLEPVSDVSGAGGGGGVERRVEPVSDVAGTEAGGGAERRVEPVSDVAGTEAGGGAERCVEPVSDVAGTEAGGGAEPRTGPVWSVPGPDERLGLLRSLADGLLATAQPGRDDRLFPGDAEQFFTPEGGLGLAHGAAGVLWALAESGVRVPGEHLDWLAGRAHALENPRPGLYDGLGGIAYVLDRLGREADARELLGRIVESPLDDLGHSLHGGLAGVGLTLLHFAGTTGDGDLLDRAGRIAERVADGATPAPEGPGKGTGAGLLRGASGGALFLLRLYERTGDTALLDHTAAALRRDLAEFGWTPGSPFADGTTGRLPLIGSGSGGTGMVLHDLLTHLPDTELAQARDAVLAATELPFVAQAGLLSGRAGVIMTRARLTNAVGRGDTCGDPDLPARPEPAPATDPVQHRHVAGLGLNAVRHRGAPAFLGQESLRISSDLATGTAGVLLALGAAWSGGRCRLPFL
ncbi:class III lanthionine synthetase LanKC [Streptomyces mayonensis]|uniref:class III lanthionine synthetase LanKC n=1 Tax=Streptomyces mayonensis TaxID=2750816 RepID=UPI001C1DFAEA|nr:class III lanthionine synthetase LanKC [Streptomyces sp. A108]MBU6532332.1 protein kinase/lanthionine synthetase C family protein [Streptomyces sp. A108]